MTQPAQPIADDELLGFLLMRLAVLLRQSSDELLQEFGISPRAFGLLYALRKQGSMSQLALSRARRMDPANMVEFLDELMARGWIRRRCDMQDRRRRLVELTTRGEAMVDETLPLVRRAEKEFLQPLTAAQSKTLKALLRELFEAHFEDPDHGHCPLSQ